MEYEFTLAVGLKGYVVLASMSFFLLSLSLLSYLIAIFITSMVKSVEKYYNYISIKLIPL